MSGDHRVSDESLDAADHFSRPRNAGSLDRVDSLVGSGSAELPDRGDTVRFQLKVDLVSLCIETARFKAFGCGALIACGSLLTERVKGCTLEEARAVRPEEIAAGLGLPDDKRYCAELVYGAMTAAIEEFYRRNGRGGMASEK